MTNTDLKPLFDNLRNATEFFNSVDGDLASISNGTKQIAAEWLETAALALGDALIAQHEAEPQDLESIQVEAVAVTRENDDGELYLDWLLEGGIAELEVPGTLLLVAHGQITDDEGSGAVYAAHVAHRANGGGDHE
ncbi:hypothetical protein ACP0H4_30640 [Pseudomonas aeruginosa]|uniref:hypothetical protein n=1 Tax=Pseudomonas phage vB_PaeS_PAO1_HW12 TaxID=1928621 RepID=UPI000FC434E6|nr:hypothetical protein [Pseudomonas aeruginosa]YP_010844236.1 hypothetical protein MPJ00_gp06 [Pseudomonas phage vB_PaeS_PAO1_HW12]MDY1100585.1 hypothetical protein [Pseudomonas aeruginosa]MDY1359649.1 hypothetical protein [Pseudomonas aeruginosa]RUB44968.1 hypothetical protein IPC1427_26890 [Pseudomonas aeruginosa]RUB65169.1 hypothetical protein IPC1428_27940 [Pseudomonas aeruginosa]